MATAIKRADSFERLAGEHRTGNSQAANGTNAETHGDKAEAIGFVHQRLFANDHGLESFEIEFRDHGAGAVDFLLFGEKQGGGADFEDIHDLGGDAIEELNHVAGFEKALAESVELFDFAAALRGMLGLLTSTSGKMARKHGNDEKSEERDPILGIGDGKSAHGRQEVEIEREHGHDGHKHGNGNAPYGGNGQNGEQKSERDRGGIDG